MKLQSVLWILLLALAACSDHGVDTTVGSLRNTPTAHAAGLAAATVRPVVRTQGQSIANAPDRGTFVDYPRGRVSQQEGALTWYPASLSEAHALRSIATGQMSFATPGGGQVQLRYLRHSEQLDGNWTWVGEVVGGDPRQKAIITFGADAVFGSIPQGTAPPLQVQTREGGLFVVAMDPSRAASAASNDDAKIPPSRPAQLPMDFAATSLDSPRKASAPLVEAASGMQTVASDLNTVDLVVGYTAGLANRLGGDSAATTRMAYLVEYGNQALGNSEIAGHYRLVGTVNVAYSDSTSNDTTLDVLTQSTDAALAPLHAARLEYGGDITMLVRDLTAEHDGCGIAWLLGGGQAEITPSDADWAYGVVSDGSYSVGNKTWYCSTSSLAHESGHILGSTHDRANAGGSGRYPYSYGYNAGGVCDLMAYCSPENVEYQVYSNPRIDSCGGVSCGAENSEDNARSLNQTIPVIAAFRAAVVPFTGKLRNDFDGDGYSDLFWRNLSDGRNVIWWAADRAIQNTLPQVNPSWAVVGTGDFDGDGQSDLFWRNATNGQNIIWPSGDRTKRRSAATVASQAWKVAAVGDFDGDGRDDIFWRNDSTGANTTWWSGEQASRKAQRAVSTSWKITGSGDFDGDGQDDVLWRNDSSGSNVVWWSGDSTRTTTLTAVTNLSWDVVAIGDFDGDGQADLFWRNRMTGENTIWWHGSSADQVRETTVSTAWKVESSADYDGDGETDVFWRNSSTGQNVVWDSGRRDNRRDLPAVVLSWTVQP